VDPAWTGAISALAGVAVGAVAEALRARASFKREKAWSLYEQRRQRLEYAYEALEQLRESYGQAYAHALHVVGTQTMPPDQPRTAVPWSRLRMLIHLYLPELIGQLQVVELTGRRMGSALGAAVMDSSLDTARNQVLIFDLDKALADLNGAVDAMRDAIVRDSAELAASAMQQAGRPLPQVRSG
jgi:hypothetical protein